MVIECKSYEDDCIFYDDWNAVVQKGDIEFYSAVTREYITDRSLLEFACGTGRIIGNLSDIISDGTGVDLSEKMLQIAKKKYNNNCKLRFFCGNMTSYRGEQKADTIICGYNSFQHLLSAEDADAFFSTCWRSLRENGILIIDVFNPDFTFLTKTPETVVLGEFYSTCLKKQIKVVETHCYNDSNHINRLEMEYSCGGQCWRTTADMKQYFPGEIEKIAANNKFLLLCKYGDYNGGPFTENSPKQIFVFEKESYNEASSSEKL